MREFQAKRKRKKKMYSTPSIICLSIILALVAKGTFGVYAKFLESKQALAASVREQTTLEKQKAELNQKISRLKTKEGVEEEIRSRYQVVKPGEKVFMLVDVADDSATTSPATTLQNIWNSIKSIFDK